MPDVWTRHPDIVRDLLKDAGFTCGVEGRFLKGRDPAWTCIHDGKAMKGDLYIHHVDKFRPGAGLSPVSDEVALALFAGLALGLVTSRWRRARP